MQWLSNIFYILIYTSSPENLRDEIGNVYLSEIIDNTDNPVEKEGDTISDYSFHKLYLLCKNDESAIIFSISSFELSILSFTVLMPESLIA